MGRLTAPVRPLQVLYYEIPDPFGAAWVGVAYDQNGKLIGLTHGPEIDWRGFYFNGEVLRRLQQYIADGQAKLLRRTTYVSHTRAFHHDGPGVRRGEHGSD